jgi:hypothetical protein
MRQAELLADAGELRAIRGLQRSLHYTGESWKPTLKYGHFENATIDISVFQKDETASITVVASLARSKNASDAIQCTRTFTKQLPNPTELE